MGRSIVTNGDFWRSCAKMREAIELPFGLVCGVAPGTGVLDGFISQRGIGSNGFFSEPLV